MISEMSSFAPHKKSSPTHHLLLSAPFLIAFTPRPAPCTHTHTHIHTHTHAHDFAMPTSRASSLFVSQLREDGVLPTALCNYVARLGWSPPRDRENHVYDSLQALAQDFDLNALHKQPAVVDPTRISFVNKRALRSWGSGGSSGVAREMRAFFQAHVLPSLVASRARFDEVTEPSKGMPNTATTTAGTAASTPAAAAEATTATPSHLLSATYIDAVLALASESVDSLADLESEFAFMWFAPGAPALLRAAGVGDDDVVRQVAGGTCTGGAAEHVLECWGRTLPDVQTSPATTASLFNAVLSLEDFAPKALKAAAKSWAKDNGLVGLCVCGGGGC